MAQVIDKITVQFYGDTQVQTAKQFRAIVESKNLSINQVLMQLIKQFVKQENK